jgi:hypothetical protein
MKDRNSGYILVYTVLAISLFVYIATSLTGSIIREIDLSDAEIAAQKAGMAADVGMECARYWQFDSGLQAFSTNAGTQIIRCDTPAGSVSFSTANGAAGGDCDSSKTYSDFVIPLSDGSCTTVSVTVSPMNPVTTTCMTAIRSVGHDNCANPTTERIRWANN